MNNNEEQDVVEEGPLEEQQEDEEKNKSKADKHCKRVLKTVTKGRENVEFFGCNYCKDVFQGPSSSAFLKHCRAKHKSKRPDLFDYPVKVKEARNFFEKPKSKMKFTADIFMGKLLTWIIKTDQPFSVVDNSEFKDLLEYLKQDIHIDSRTTIMRRLDELYEVQKQNLKEKLKQFSSKYSITCDVWTSQNQLSFFGFTIHYIDDDWKLQEGLIAFKYLQGEHDGESLGKELLSDLDDLDITDRLLGVTADNASNNTTMLQYVESHYRERCPNSAFSVNWNQIECMAHVLNLAVQQILKFFKQPIDSEKYQPHSGSSDRMVTAVSRLSFICRKIRASPKLRRILENVCNQRKIECLIPIIDVKTRWNSTYDMLVRALELKEVISDTIYQKKDNYLIALLLDDDDWKCINQLIKVLKPLKRNYFACFKKRRSSLYY